MHGTTKRDSQTSQTGTKVNEQEYIVKEFGGLKTDTDPKQTPPEYFTKCENFQFPKTGIPGIEKILMPDSLKTLSAGHHVDGIFEYRYLDTNGVLQTENIGVCDGTIYKTILGTAVSLKTGLTTGRAVFAAYKDNLFIANGKNYVNVYYGSLGIVAEMGAPAAVATASAGNPNGTYYYAMSYVTDGGEEVIGSVSNTVTVSSKQITLNLPIGYIGTRSRKIFRIANGGTQLKLLATINDNVTLIYTDNIADGALGANIPATNNELPKPYILTVANQSLYGAKVDKYPTQVFKTDANNQVWDVANFIDVANYGNDNTPIEGIGTDFTKVVVGTGKQIYFLDLMNDTNGATFVQSTRANVGIKSGYSVVSVPAYGNFPGGLMFVSTLNDVRIMNGLDGLPVSTVLNNVRTENWAQDIRGSLSNSLLSYSNIAAEFFDYKYHIAIDDITYVFDIRNQHWTTQNIVTISHQSKPRCFAVMGSGPQKYYNGQSDGTIEQMYVNVQYKGEDVTATLVSPQLYADRFYKWFHKMTWWFTSGVNSTATISLVLDSNIYQPFTGTLTLTGGAFNSTYFNSTLYQTGGSVDSDFRCVNIYNPCRWAQYTVTCTDGNITFLQYAITGEALPNKEASQ